MNSNRNDFFFLFLSVIVINDISSVFLQDSHSKDVILF